MALQINNVKQLQQLLASAKININDPEELTDLIRSINGLDVSPEVRKQELASRERRLAAQHAHEEKVRQLEHTERMQALQQGLAFPDPETAEVLGAPGRFRGSSGSYLLVTGTNESLLWPLYWPDGDHLGNQ